MGSKTNLENDKTADCWLCWCLRNSIRLLRVDYCMKLNISVEDKEQVKEMSLTDDTRTSKHINTQ